MEHISEASLVARPTGTSRLKARCKTSAARLILRAEPPFAVRPASVRIPPGGRVNTLIQVTGPPGRQVIELVLPTVSRPVAQWRP